jgi:hypothetical protein
MSAKDQIQDEAGDRLDQTEPKLVEVTVDGVAKTIPRGKYLVPPPVKFSRSLT